MKKGFTLTIFLVVMFLIHLISNLSRAGGIEWYESLLKPSWAPTPAALIRIWAGMFIFKTVAGALLWVAHKSHTQRLCVELWIGIIALDIFWHFSFFRYENLILTMGVFICLIAGTGSLLYFARRVDKAVFFFLIPYQIWLFYAFVLSVRLIQLNG